jgi:cytochrome c biogenesis protein CcmG/thiol:disulfide interchange protein DsbE
MRARRLIRSLLPLLLLALAACGRAPAGPLVAGDRLPDLAVADLSGETLSLAGAPGQAVWLSFWASWCAPCREEWPDINAAARDLGPAVRIVAVAVNEPPATVAAFVADHPADFSVALDPEGALAERFGVIGFPTHILIDSDGVLQRVVRGPHDGPRAAGLLGLPTAQSGAP